MSDCNEDSCCPNVNDQCCQPSPFDYSTETFSNSRQCYTAVCSGGQIGEPVERCKEAGTYSAATQAQADATALAAATAEAIAALVCTCTGIAAPTISPADESVITWPQLITITHPTEGAQIYYKTFATSYVLYTAPFLLQNPGTQVTAKAVISSCTTAESVADYTADVGCVAYGGDSANGLNQTVSFVDPCVTPVGFQIKFGDGLEITAPGNSNQYDTEAECSTGNNGLTVSFYHDGGESGRTISIYLKDNPYPDNIAGTPTPQFKLITPIGDANTVTPDIFSNSESFFYPQFGFPGDLPFPSGQYTVEYVGGAMKYNSGFGWSVNFAVGARSELYQSGPYSHENLLAVYNLYEFYPYVQMWDEVCPLICREAPRQHENGSIIIGPFSIDVEIFSITSLFFADDYSFDSEALSYGECGRNGRPVCPNTIIKGTGLMGGVLTAGSTTSFKVWDTDGAHCYAVGYLGVRAVGADTDCSVVDPDYDTCACSEDPSIEKLMRATQERYRIGQGFLADPLDLDGTWLSWPDNSLAQSAGKYPIDTFYDADSFAEKIAAIQSIRDNIVDSWLLNYSPVAVFDGLATAPYYTEETLLLPNPDWAALIADGDAPALAEAMDALDTMRGCICQLFNILIQNQDSEITQRHGDSSDAGGCDALKSSAIANWNAAPVAGPFGALLPLIRSSANPVESPTSALIDSNYGKFEVPNLVNYGIGTATAYAKQRPYQDAPVSQLAYEEFAPPVAFNSLFYSFETTASGSAYESDNFGFVADNFVFDQACDADSLPYGWEILAFAMLVQKSNIPSVGDWVYYP